MAHIHHIASSTARAPWNDRASGDVPVRASGRRHPDAPLPAPSARECEVWQLVAYGYTVPQVAAALGISAHTVKNHTTKLHLKLGVGTTAELGRLWGEIHAGADAP